MTSNGQRFASLRNYEAEQALLAGLLADNRQISRVADIVGADHFADALHGRIFQAIDDLQRQGKTANFLTLKTKFDADPALAEAGGARYLAQLENAVVTMLGLPDYAMTIRDLANRRRCVEIAEGLASAAADVDNSIDTAASEIASTLRDVVAGEQEIRTNADYAEEVVRDLQTRSIKYSTGLPRLDKALGGGLYPGKLVSIAARKKVGKTVLLGTMSFNLNWGGNPHGFFALEMGPKQIEHRQMARRMQMNSMRFLVSRDKALIEGAADYAATVPRNCFYEDAPGITLADLERRIMRLVIRKRIVGFFLDYWQLVEGKNGRDTEEWHLRTVAQRLANLCRREGIWGVVAAQINQDGNTRGGEGLRLASDVYFALQRDRDSEEAWLEMQDSRYTPYRSVGTKERAGLRLDSNGPWFEDIDFYGDAPEGSGA
jgi:replicative DNA helicase